jgi:hypothetical protein
MLKTFVPSACNNIEFKWTFNFFEMLEVFVNVREPIEMLDKRSLFSMFGKIGLRGGLKFIFLKSMELLD